MTIENLNILNLLKEHKTLSRDEIFSKLESSPDMRDLATKLAEMRKEGWITRNSFNRYSLTIDGKALVGGRPMEPEPEPESIRESAEESAVEPVAVKVPAPEPELKTPKSKPPKVPKPSLAYVFDLFMGIDNQIPEEVSIVLERGASFLVFENLKFNLRQATDLDAVITAVNLIERKA